MSFRESTYNTHIHKHVRKYSYVCIYFVRNLQLNSYIQVETIVKLLLNTLLANSHVNLSKALFIY